MARKLKQDQQRAQGSSQYRVDEETAANDISEDMIQELVSVRI